jgi:hypothetical protein
MSVGSEKVGTIRRIKRQADRTLLYLEEEPDDYHVIATVEEGDKLRNGDTVHYEPEGVNFGWLVKTKNRQKKTRGTSTLSLPQQSSSPA